MSQVISLRLLVDLTDKRVLFAQVGKDCVDLLFQLLSMPMASIINLTNAEGMSGSLPNLYRSLESLDSAYVLPNRKKETYLKPTPAISGSGLKMLPTAAAEPLEKSVYVCGVCYLYAAGDPRVKCPECLGPISMKSTYLEMELTDDPGLVKDLVTYMVHDDLTIVPVFPMSEINKLTEFGIKDLGTVEQKTIMLGPDEVFFIFFVSFFYFMKITNGFFFFF